MKKINLMVLLLALPLLGKSQSESLQQVYKSYAYLDETFTLNISGNFLKMASWFDHENVDDSFENFVHSVDHIKILKVPKGRDGMGKGEIDYFKKELYREKFEDLMYVRDEDGGKFYILVNERRGNIEDLIIFGEGENEVIFIELIGHMNSRDVSRFCKKIQMHEI